MNRRHALALLRLAFALLTIVALVAQYLHRANPSGFYTINFLSFFTNESNLFAAALLLYGADRGLLSREPEGSSTYDLLRGASVLYMTITGVVFALLLSRSSQALPWANTVVHQLMPIVIVLDWLVDPPSSRITPRRASRWLVFPVVYFGYTLIHGAIEDWYPYPFLNVDIHGYAGVLAIAVGLLIAIGAVGVVVALLGNRRRPLPKHS